MFLLVASCAGALTGTIQDVQHVVIMMMENRSFDEYYGGLSGVRGYNDPNALILQNGNTVFYQPQNALETENTNYVLPFQPPTQCVLDVGHDWYYGHLGWDQGKWDLWIPARSARSMIYCVRSDISYYYALADAYTICDAYFSSIFAPTYPNRMYEFTGTIDPHGLNGGPLLSNQVPTNGFTWTTYAERLQVAGVSWRVYQSSDDYMEANPLRWFAQFKNLNPGNPLYDRGLVFVTNLVDAFRTDVLSNTLPQVSWVIPGWTVSEHPPYSPTLGQALVKQIVDALAVNSDVRNSTVFMLTYDENGGFFDHVPSPVPPPGTPDEFIYGWPIGPGPRVPMLIVSPWSRGGHVCSQVFDHTSTIRFLETWTGVQETNISVWRRQLCGDLTSAFDFAHPDYSQPTLPDAIGTGCGSGIDPQVPSTQSMPSQEPGTKPGLRLPYQPNASSSLDCASGRLWINMANSGTSSVHLAIYPNAYRHDDPWQYDVLPGTPVANFFNVATVGGGFYDFTCYGPNGFQRRFAGNMNTNCNQIEAVSAFAPDLGNLIVTLTNASVGPVTFTITDAYHLGGPWTITVQPSDAFTNIFGVGTNNNGWYDYTAVADLDSVFLRRFAGHIENIPLPPPPVQTNLLLSASLDSGNFVLTYPLAAGAVAVEQSLDCSSGVWTTLNVTPSTVGSNAVVTIPATGAVSYFRLRR
jgi:phospholipase C